MPVSIGCLEVLLDTSWRGIGYAFRKIYVQHVFGITSGSLSCAEVTEWLALLQEIHSLDIKGSSSKAIIERLQTTSLSAVSETNGAGETGRVTGYFFLGIHDSASVASTTSAWFVR